jgi:maltokinase
VTPDELAEAVARTPWSALVPAHRRDGDEQPAGGATCVEALPLGPDRWLAVVADDDGEAFPVPLVTDGVGVRRARPGDGAGDAMLAVLAAGTRRAGGFELTSWHDEPCAGERGITADQTNESVVVGDCAVVKWSFRLDDSPAPALLSALHDRGFTGMPRPWGLVRWHPGGDAAPLLVASVVTYLPGAVDGWTWAVDDLRTALVSGSDEPVRRAGTAVGALVADLHAALAHDPVPAGDDDAARWAAEAHGDLETALAATSGAAHDVLARHADAVRAALDVVPTLGGTPLIPVHGDLHVGQVLRAGTPDEPVHAITDFDGNPVVPPAERALPQPAALDVAGMAQSLTHAGLVLRRHDPQADAAAVAALVDASVASFLDAYTTTLDAHGAASLYEPALLRPFRLRQVCREFTYAATHLPRWSYVPEAALPALISEGDPR